MMLGCAKSEDTRLIAAKLYYENSNHVITAPQLHGQTELAQAGMKIPTYR